VDTTLGKGEQRLAAEQRARVLIDRQLGEARCAVQDKEDLSLLRRSRNRIS